MSWRDCEFMWDSLYATGLSPTIQQTLDTLGAHLADRAGTSPIATDGRNTQVVYDYLNREGRTYQRSATIFSNGLRLGSASYGPDDYCHADAYITDWAHDQAGMQPAGWQTDDEDLSSGHAAGDVLHANSFHMGGPVRSQPTDLTGTGWTKPGSVQFVGFNHEMTHSLVGAGGGQAYGEMWSAAAEVVGGIDHIEPTSSEVPYTWSLLAWVNAGTQPPSGVGYRYSLSNYQARTSWMAYLAYNFLNADTNRTLAGMRDDLLYRWNRSSSPTRLTGLAPLLSDAECTTCAAKDYFRPQGVPLAGTERLALLHHNWRVANFVNNPNLAEGQYGYPAWGHFSPAVNQKAWQSIDGDPLDDIVALPAIVDLDQTVLQRDTTFKGARSFRGSEYPLALVPYGSNYWVVRATGSVLSADRDLVVRISPQAYHRGCLTPSLPGLPPFVRRAGVRLMASAVAYDRLDASGDESNLWQHPESAVYSTAVTWVDCDTTATDLKLVVPSFGATHKAVVVVITLADDQGGYYADIGDVAYDEAMPYRLEIGVAPSPAPALPNFAVGAVEGFQDDWPTWSPAGDEIAYSSISSAGSPAQIYRRKFDGSAPAVIAAQSFPQYCPDWSPRGDRIAWQGFPSAGHMDIWIADLSAPGSAPTQLTNFVGTSFFPAFQPNGQGLAYIHDVGASFQLRWIGIDGTGERLIATFPVPSAGVAPLRQVPPRWTRDGQYLVVSNNVTGQLVRVTVSNGDTLAIGPSLDLYSFDLPPGSGRLAVTDRTPLLNRYAIGAALCTGSPDPWFPSIALNRIALVDTAVATRDTAFRLVERGATNFNLKLSPDGTQVAYSRARFDATADGRDVWVGRTTWNRAPVMSSSVQATYSVPDCTPFELSLSATDPDSDPLTYEAAYLPTGAMFQAGHTIYWPYPATGTYWLTTRALDPRGGVATKVVRVDVFHQETCGGEGGEDPDPILGGPHAIRQAGSNRLIGGTGPAHVANTFLDGAPVGSWVAQTARLMLAQSDAAGQVSTRFVALRPGALRLDRVRLIAVDHAPGTVAASTGTGVVTGPKLPPVRMTTGASEDLSGTLTGVEGEGRLFAAGSTLEIEWAAGEPALGLMLDCARASAADASAEWGVRVEVPGEGGWEPTGLVHPRSGYDLLAAELGTATRARLTFVSDTYVHEVTGYGAETDSPATVTVVDLSGTDAEEGVARLATSDGDPVEMAQGQKVTLQFDGPVPDESRQRTLFLDLVASVVRDGAAATSGQRADESLPTRFALHGNRPNPFGRGTTIHFDTPRASNVRIEVFDAQGRRVATLADGRFGPGSHTLQWDGTNAAGVRVQPGVYLYRMNAEGFQEQRRMVLLGR